MMLKGMIHESMKKDTQEKKKYNKPHRTNETTRIELKRDNFILCDIERISMYIFRNM